MKILFIGARLFDDVALFVQNKGINTILTESNPASTNLDLADTHYIVPRGMEVPKEIALKEDVDAVIPLIGIDKPLIEVSRLKMELENDYGIPVIASPLDAVIIAGDKLKTKEFFIKNNIRTPEYMEVHKKGSELSLPFVLKRLEGQGGSGNKIFATKGDLDGYVGGFEDSFAEKFVEGAEISIEVLRFNGESIPLVPVYKGETTLKGMHPLEKIRNAPLNINSIDNQDIRQKASRLADSLAIEGVVDIDLIYDRKEDVSYFIEMNTRPSGTRYLTAASTNINPLHELVHMAAGEWDKKGLEERMEEYFALEIPIGSYKTDKNNYKFRDFNVRDSWVIHGPYKFQRITIRALSLEEAYKTARRMDIDLSKFH